MLGEPMDFFGWILALGGVGVRLFSLFSEREVGLIRGTSWGFPFGRSANFPEGDSAWILEFLAFVVFETSGSV
jgi:hypothetical protein